MTRDSVALLWAQILSALVTVAGLIVDPRLGLLDPSYLGLSETATHRLIAAAVAVLYVSGKLSRSPLPGAKSDAASGTSASGWLVPVLITASLGLGMAACASSGGPRAKTNAVVSLQAAETLLEASHDAERLLCNGTANQLAPIQHCNAQGIALGLTDERHHQLAVFYAHAFDVQGKAALALKAWRAGDPAPATVAQYAKDAADIVDVANQIAPGNPFVTKAQAALAQINQVLTIIGGK